MAGGSVTWYSMEPCLACRKLRSSSQAAKVPVLNAAPLLGRSSWVCLIENKGAVCLPCADLDHLEFLPTGNAALTRRAKVA